MRTLRAKPSASYSFTLWFFIVLCLLLMLFFLNAGSPVALLFFLFTNICLIQLVRLGPLELNDEYIRLRLATGCFEIGWDEVQCIELSPFETFMVLHGADKKLVIYAQGLWGGPDKTEMEALFQRQIEKREINVVVTEKSHWQICRGTRVKEF